MGGRYEEAVAVKKVPFVAMRKPVNIKGASLTGTVSRGFRCTLLGRVISRGPFLNGFCRGVRR